VRTSGHAISTQASTALAAGLIAFPVAGGTGHPLTPATSHPAASRTAPAAPATREPGLSITVTDGRATAAAGQRLTYTVSVRDTGTAPARHLKITQTLSPGLQFLSASGNGAATATQVTWHASLPAMGTRTFRVTARVTPTPPRVTRLAAVACAALPGDSRPIVCAAHLDRLPLAAPSAARPAAPGGNLPAYAAAGVAVLAAGLLILTAARRIRRRRQPAPG
jgi:uncharacterized repeat protein (TIGR01451 family)